MLTEKEQREMDHIARVFEKFLYAKLFAYEGFEAEGLKVIVGPPDSDEQSSQTKAG